MPGRFDRFTLRGYFLLPLLAATGCSAAQPPLATNELAEHARDEGEAACCAGESEHGGGASCSSDGHAQGAATAGTLRLLSDASSVCMVRDHFMGRPQIPVVVDGRTYYGCCEGCKQRLLRDPNARAAIDPVSRRSIDKAEAIVAVDAHGGLLYFESEANLRAYARDTRQRVN